MNKIRIAFCLTIIAVFSTRDAAAMPNPWTECGKDMVCGAKKAGFDFPLNVENRTVRAMDGMFEIRFSLNDEQRVTARKSQIADGEPDENGIIDISGDYNVYPVNKTITLENDVKFAVRGEENRYKVVTFAAETGYYAFMCDDGLSLSDIKRLYELAADAEAPK